MKFNKTKLERLMRERGWLNDQGATQLAAAIIELGETCHPMTVQRWLDGMTPSTRKLWALGKVFGVSADSFLKDEVAK